MLLRNKPLTAVKPSAMRATLGQRSIEGEANAMGRRSASVRVARGDLPDDAAVCEKPYIREKITHASTVHGLRDHIARQHERCPSSRPPQPLDRASRRRGVRRRSSKHIDSAGVGCSKPARIMLVDALASTPGVFL